MFEYPVAIATTLPCEIPPLPPPVFVIITSPVDWFTLIPVPAVIDVTPPPGAYDADRAYDALNTVPTIFEEVTYEAVKAVTTYDAVAAYDELRTVPTMAEDVTYDAVNAVTTYDAVAA